MVFGISRRYKIFEKGVQEMNKREFSRGSQWNLWDLHVHTPASILNTQFGDDWDNYTKLLFKKAIKQNISAIGITDYFSIEGYKKIREE